jgi:hypothetical protein
MHKIKKTKLNMANEIELQTQRNLKKFIKRNDKEIKKTWQKEPVEFI